MKEGSFGFGLGAEKNDESDLASLTVFTTTFWISFLTADVAPPGNRVEEEDGMDEMACFFGGGTDLEDKVSLGFRFLVVSIEVPTANACGISDFAFLYRSAEVATREVIC